MTLYHSTYASGAQVQPVPMGAGEVCRVRAVYAVTAAIAGAANDIIEMVGLPPGCEVVDVILDSDDLDAHGTPTIDVDVGIMSGAWQEVDASRTCGDEFLDGDTTPRAGGVARPSLASAFRVAKSDAWRGIGVKIAAAAATGQLGSIGLTVCYASA
ncbi:hypothetical protein [Oricola sp.]|uniref:hypothetical protein n=1 Tax=Oricola sp. TaxID=1979950 RepID=UPI003BABDA1B